MRVVAAVLAAGSGSRFGSNKILERLGDRAVWEWSFDTLASHPEIDGVLLVGDIDPGKRRPLSIVPGGATRQESVQNALRACPEDAELLLLQDAARPFISTELISRVIAAAKTSGAAAPAIPVVDTIRERQQEGFKLLDRSNLLAMQTPQAVNVYILLRAFATNPPEMTDDLALVESIGFPPTLVEGDPLAFKITHPTDLLKARGILGDVETRTGLGYDVHAFSDDATRTLYLGGIPFPGHRALEGHSDADVVLHAAVAALLGAAALGDIGQHFPPSDPKWKGEPSKTFLIHAAQLLQTNGWQIVNLDIAMIAETPKIMPHAEEIRQAIADALKISMDRVSLKATTNEGLGSIGRGEGISAFATATIRRQS